MSNDKLWEGMTANDLKPDWNDPVLATAYREFATARIADLEAENTELRKALRKLKKAADNGEWHDSEDCEVEGVADYCALCAAIQTARRVLIKKGA